MGRKRCNPKDREAGTHKCVDAAEEMQASIHEGKEMRQETLWEHLVPTVVLTPPVAQRVKEAYHLVTLGFLGASLDSQSYVFKDLRPAQDIYPNQLPLLLSMGICVKCVGVFGGCQSISQS